MLRTLICTSCCLVIVGCGATKPPASLSVEEEEAEIVSALLRQYNVPGVSVAMILDGEVELVEGYGVLRAGKTVPVNRRTVFQAASLSKPVVAYGVHVLVEEGKLALDRPLTEYLDAPYLDDPRIDRITARIVLSHTTGFPNWRPRHRELSGRRPVLAMGRRRAIQGARGRLSLSQSRGRGVRERQLGARRGSPARGASARTVRLSRLPNDQLPSLARSDLHGQE